MSIILRGFILLSGISMASLIIYLLVKKRISEKNSVIWILSSLLILGLSAIPKILDKVAELIGVYYPPSLLFLLTSIIFLICILYLSVQISALLNKLNVLSQEFAIKSLKYDREINKLKDKLNEVKES